MKNRFSSEDIIAVTNQLQKFIGMRVNQVYDVDTKTYLIKLNRYEEKVTLLLESGIRIHTTEFEWPKNSAPSGFSMKLRKHIKNKRLEKLSQLGVDRVLDLQFGINEAAYHVILEMYDKGNIVFTDHQYIILNILRPRTDKGNDDVKFVVRQQYPTELVKQRDLQLLQSVEFAVNSANAGESLRKILMSTTNFGKALIDHICLSQEFSSSASIGNGFNVASDMIRLMTGLDLAQKIIEEISNGSNGYIIQKEEPGLTKDQKILKNVEFHPYLFNQHKNLPYVQYDNFDKAVDLFFSSMEAQKIEGKALQKEREAMKKLENVKKDHEKRLQKLNQEQEDDVSKAELIETNLDLVEKAIVIIRSAVANQISWEGIGDLIQEAQAEGDEVALSIKKLKLEINHFTMLLRNPFKTESKNDNPTLVDIDLGLSAYKNARKYYNQKRAHAKKEQKTIEASEKAFKNAEKKTKQTLKEAAVISMITKARKPMWFEKFLWCISSENYLIIAGRDIPQNEVIVKRYMKKNDIYVHAEIHGASSVLIKNPFQTEVPPKTLNEAGTLAVCYSAAWDAKVLTSAWWVYSHQVSKTAPTGEYLTAGSFMIRGKKNYLLPSQLVLGFGFLFKLDDDSMEQHIGERRVKSDESETMSEVIHHSEEEEEEDIQIEEHSDSDEEKDENLKTSRSETATFDDGNDNITNSTLPIDQKDITFPDTQVNLHTLNRTISQESYSSLKSSVLSEENSTTLIISSQRQSKNKVFHNKAKPPHPPAVPNNAEGKQNQPKRGQKGKLKKIKEKYKDQDDEERELKMKILASAGVTKVNKKKKGKGSNLSAQPMASTDSEQSAAVSDSAKLNKKAVIEPVEEQVNIRIHENEIDESDDDEETEETLTTSEQNLLSSLTGQPLPEDTLLFAVPVCAPYASIHNYKYKVKMMPGTGRRGKAAKTALNIFLHDKTGIQKEKDCLRSSKDQDISRNFPGKVKISHSYVKKK